MDGTVYSAAEDRAMKYVVATLLCLAVMVHAAPKDRIWVKACEAQIDVSSADLVVCLELSKVEDLTEATNSLSRKIKWHMTDVWCVTIDKDGKKTETKIKDKKDTGTVK